MREGGAGGHSSPDRRRLLRSFSFDRAARPLRYGQSLRPRLNTSRAQSRQTMARPLSVSRFSPNFETGLTLMQ